MTTVVDEFLEDSYVILQTQSQNATSFSFDLYSQLVAGIDGPPIIIFFAFFVVLLVYYIIQFRQLKKNQHILYWMNIALAFFSSFQNITRLASELAFLSPVYRVAFDLNNVIKGIDRSMSAVLLYNQILIMGFIGFVFLKTTRLTNYISEKEFKISKFWLIALLIFFFALFLLGHVLIIAVLHGLRGSGISPPSQQQLSIVIFITPMIIMFLGMVACAIYLNTYGFRLYGALKASKKKIKEMMKRATHEEGSSTIQPYEMEDLTSTSENIKSGGTGTGIAASGTGIAGTAGGGDSSSHHQNGKANSPSNNEMSDSLPGVQSPTKKESVSTSVVDKSFSKGVKKANQEFDNTYQLKKRALRKSLGLQIGLTICFFIQLLGLAFLPGATGWQYSLLFYHCFSNIAIVGFLIIQLVLISPLREVQRLFKTPSNLSEKKKKKQQEKQQHHQLNNSATMESHESV